MIIRQVKIKHLIQLNRPKRFDMSKIDDKLNEVLGIAEDVTYENEVKTERKKDLIVPEEKDPEIDFETGRKNLYNLIDKGNEAIDGILI